MAEQGVEVLTPHAELLTAFETLKKDKQALMALTALQKTDIEKLTKSLEEEKAIVSELETKLKLKQASTDLQIAEVEDFSKETIKDAVEKNSKYSAKIADLELIIAQTKKEKEQLLERTAALARRDQLQKASLSAMTEEISLLTDKVGQFQEQFANLASRSLAIHKLDEKREELESSEWQEEKRRLTRQITRLESSCNQLKHSEEIMKESYVQTLTKHKSQWNTEKIMLQQKLKELTSEKQNIESEVEKIAQMLEQETIERVGSKLLSPKATEEPVAEEPTEPKEVEVFDQ